MSTRLYSDYVGHEYQKKKSRDAARSRRGQQNDEFLELASQLPISLFETSQLDRLSIMRLTNSYVKIKHILNQLTVVQDFEVPFLELQSDSEEQESLLSEALDGFVFVVGPDGRCLYISDSVSTYLGLMPMEITGNSFYKYVHPCDHEEVAKELCGKIPLEDMEIFDGLFCSDSVFMMSNNLKGGSKDRGDVKKQPYRSFFVRIKSTLTSRGKSVNLKASTYRVVHCTGCLKHLPGITGEVKEDSPLCFVGIGVPLMFTPTFEVPLDQATFSSHHSLDLTFVFSESGIEQILGYQPSEVLGVSLYQFLHGSDQDVLSKCHKTLLTKGQSVSGYYRLLAKNGGWIWVQTKASIVYASRSCQPQFVLCVHYAISKVEQEDMLVSLDQVLRKNEMQESPRNSPAEGAAAGHNLQKNKRLPVIRRVSNRNGLSQLEKADKEPSASDSSYHNDLSSMDLSGVCSLDDEDMPEICDEKDSRESEYLSTLSGCPTMDGEEPSIGDYLDCPTALSTSSLTSSQLTSSSLASPLLTSTLTSSSMTSPLLTSSSLTSSRLTSSSLTLPLLTSSSLTSSHLTSSSVIQDTADREEKMTTNEYRAPFIPPPLGDSQFAVDEKELEIFNMHNPLCCCTEDMSWKTVEAWDPNNELDRQKTFIKRNLSTPTFFPLAEKINPEP